MIDTVKHMRNESDQELVVCHPDMTRTYVPPGGTLKDARVTNLGEVRKQASVTMDLGEIKERGSGQGRMQLRD